MCLDEAQFWAKMPLLETLRLKVTDMETETIGTNFEFVALKPEDPASNKR